MECQKQLKMRMMESDTHEESEGCGKEQFFDFVFEAENFLDSETETEMEESLNAVIRRFNKDNAIDEDDTDFAEEVVDIVKDLNGCCKHFAEEGSTFFKHCSKRKIMALTHMARWMFNKHITDITHRDANPSKLKRIQQLIRPHKEYIRKIANPKVSMHEKRKVLQKAKLGEALTATLENIVKINKKNN